MRSSEIAITGICAALYAVIGLLTSFGLSLGGVAFWPAVVIPSIFAVLFGPWVGGIGAAIGIFIRDIMYHGDPLLSLSAGVTSNFAMCFLIGYFSRTNLSRKKLGFGVIIGGIIIVVGILLPTVLLPTESLLFTGLTTSEIIALLTLVVIASILAVVIIFAFKKEWRNFSVGALIGQGVGATIVAIAVWIYSNLFFSPNGYFKSPIPSSFVPLVFVWTVATEIPFVLVLGPPIIKACYRAFPSRTFSQKIEKKAT
ncbi:hypothetical protein G4O51_00815 [Candidatus Bathyarchaeota archaeon A05DMB-2]|jgi:uncharacterized membrane protein|nr:hypothetical protein [Candidatus Bathyarchaeota archaeon A05DMB-2]